MRIIDLLKVAPALYRTGRAVHLVGPPGVGKSDVVTKTLPKILSAAFGGEEFGVGGFLAPTADAPDVRGFLVPTKLPDGTPSSFYTRSAFLPSKEYLAAHPRGVFFIDERNSSDVLMQKALATVILDRKFGEEKLPEGWQVWSASNRVEDGSGASKALKMMTNRECLIPLEADAVSYSLWAEEQRKHPMMIAFAKNHPLSVFANAVPKHDSPFSTARSFTAASDYISEVAGTDAQGNPNMKIQLDSLQMQVVSGFIGDHCSAELAAHFKLGDQLPEIGEIEADPMTAKCPDAKSLHVAYVCAQMLLHHATAKNIDVLWQYAERLPREIQVSTAANLVARGGGVLINSTRMTTWIQKNSALINLSHSKR